MNFVNNRAEKQTGIDFNADGYVGGEGLESKIERITHVDLNGDRIIGRLPDTIPGGGGGLPPMDYGSGYNAPGPY